MNQAKQVELYDKVIYYKGRVWTIYGLTGNHDGVFVYQGLKPYETFQYDSYSSKRNVCYIDIDEVLECIIEGNQIEECVKNEKIAQSKKLNKKMAVEFFAEFTGHARTKINSEIKESGNGFEVVLGMVRYNLWKLDGRLHLNHNIHAHTTGTVFDFVTWKHDSLYREAQQKEFKREIIDEYKYNHNCSCDE
ncbi:hypothetical protein ACFOQM_04060 [Paenibacillus sp. GCM10012307]|uniref:Uncharacterized protein n=1 Tax=Paenibacillus roseus TaxID=2798579 RepID=A0A934J517_9BACL|nr:hypothetical protein [Paenibacillus roseus]MBJ6360487.1 hypothetical protein [Paenibacillus roseus]